MGGKVSQKTVVVTGFQKQSWWWTMVSFKTSYPWREPESTWFQIWSSVGAHTHPHSNMNTESRKHLESHSSILLNIAVGVGCIFNTDLSNIILGLLLYWWWQLLPPVPFMFDSLFHACTNPHTWITHSSRGTVCVLCLNECGFLLPLSVNMQQCLSPTWFLPKDPNLKRGEQNVSCH